MIFTTVSMSSWLYAYRSKLRCDILQSCLLFQSIFSPGSCSKAASRAVAWTLATKCSTGPSFRAKCSSVEPSAVRTTFCCVASVALFCVASGPIPTLSSGQPSPVPARAPDETILANSKSPCDVSTGTSTTLSAKLPPELSFAAFAKCLFTRGFGAGKPLTAVCKLPYNSVPGQLETSRIHDTRLIDVPLILRAVYLGATKYLASIATACLFFAP